MNSINSYTKKQSRKSNCRSNKDHRLRSDRHDNFPNGFIEEWSLSSDQSIYDKSEYRPSPSKSSNQISTDIYSKRGVIAVTKTKPQKQSFNLDSNMSSLVIPGNKHISSLTYDAKPHSTSTSRDKSLRSEFKHSLISEGKLSSMSEIKSSLESRLDSINERNYEVAKTESKSEKQQTNGGFNPVSIILSTQNNLMLNKETGYDIKFNTGMLEGTGIVINETGNIITFHDEGSYRFDISGEAVLYSDVEVKLVYHSEFFPEDVKAFSESKIPKDEGKLQLRGIPTILPLQKNQTIIAKLIPIPDESMVLLAGTRLLIHKVS